MKQKFGIKRVDNNQITPVKENTKLTFQAFNLALGKSSKRQL